MLQWEMRDVAVRNKKRMAAPVSGRERKRRRPGGETEVSRSYRKLIRLRRMEGNGHYHCFSIILSGKKLFSMSDAIVRYLPLTSGEARLPITSVLHARSLNSSGCCCRAGRSTS